MYAHSSQACGRNEWRVGIRWRKRISLRALSTTGAQPASPCGNAQCWWPLMFYKWHLKSKFLFRFPQCLNIAQFFLKCESNKTHKGSGFELPASSLWCLLTDLSQVDQALGRLARWKVCDQASHKPAAQQAWVDDGVRNTRLRSCIDLEQQSPWGRRSVQI